VNSRSRKLSDRRQESNAVQDVCRVSRTLIEVVHPGPAEGAVRTREPGRLDDMGLDAETGGQAGEIVPVFWGISGS
jgi:hypothetical protein